MKKEGKKKSLNKLMIGAIIGTAILGVGSISKTRKGKSILGRIKNCLFEFGKDFTEGMRDMKSWFRGFKKK